MIKHYCLYFLILISLSAFARDWTIYISNEICADYTWVIDEAQTRDAVAELIRAHLDLMTATDSEPWELRNRYTCTITNEALFFLAKYPEREDELVRRVREGRFQLSPFLCNTNWGFPGVEGFLRSLYPAKRLAVKWNVPLEHAVHSELPSFPWGAASLLAGSGIRWCAKPFYDYDAHFETLKNPPLFEYEGVDGSRLRVVLDPWTCQHFSYAQGAGILKRVWHADNQTTVEGFWLPHFEALENYPLNIILAQGTHGDIALDSRQEVQIVHDGIRNYNRNLQRPAKLAHATFNMFTDVVDSVQNVAPFLPMIRGEFGHAWELWPVTLAKYAAQTREGERRLLAAEALLASVDASLGKAPFANLHRSAEWHLAMLLDHSWNGSNDENRQVNAAIRKTFSQNLLQETDRLSTLAWQKLGLPNAKPEITLFNPTGMTRSGIVSLPWDGDSLPVIRSEGKTMPVQIIVDQGEKRVVLNSKELPAFAFARYQIEGAVNYPQMSMHDSRIESPYYRIIADSVEKEFPRIFHRPTDQILTSGEGFLQLFHRADQVTKPQYGPARVIADGPVLSTMEVDGSLPDCEFSMALTIYQKIDRLDVSVRLKKRPVKEAEALFLAFGEHAKSLRVETCGAVVRPYPQPEGDLLPGADAARMVVQGFVTAELDDGLHIVITPLDAFCLRPDISPLAFELVGNDQNFQESTRNQNGETDFLFRFSLQLGAKPIEDANAFVFSRRVMQPILAAHGAPTVPLPEPKVILAEEGVMVTTMKPADPHFGDGFILRLWETAGETKETRLRFAERMTVTSCDLLEQDQRIIAVQHKSVRIPLRARGFAAVRLE